ncbi:MAG: AEC family transporter [Clostridiales bacterium]|nr:AEC family transporter [Clostridiales bacterium]
MELSVITAKQVFILFILIFSGFGCVKAGVIKAESKKAFSDLLLYLIVPAMIINSYITEFDSSVFSNLIKAFLLSALFMAAAFAITFTAGIKIKGENAPIAKFACIFSNAAYMGFPLIEALFGSEGLLYASAYVTVFNILVWTVGYLMVSKTADFREIAKKIATTPAVISVIVGLIIFLCRIPVPEIISRPLSYIGSMNTPISMLITGIIIANSSFSRIAKNKLILFVIAFRMIVIPSFCFCIFYLLGLSGTAANTVLLLEACPSAAITSVFAVQFGYDEDLAAGAVVITTFLSIITLPVFAYLITSVV